MVFSARLRWGIGVALTGVSLLAPLGSTAVAHSRSAERQAEAASGWQAVLSPAVVEFDEVPAGATASMQLSLVLTSSGFEGLVQITSVEVSCGCITADWPRSPVALALGLPVEMPITIMY